jgi:hypothetical protein
VKKFCVSVVQTTRICHHVEADSPEEALSKVREDPDHYAEEWHPVGDEDEFDSAEVGELRDQPSGPPSQPR